MTEPRSDRFAERSRPWLVGTSVILLLCCGTAAAQAQTAPAGVVAAAATPPKLPPKGPRQVADELAIILQRQKTPWQVYANYVLIYQGFAAREANRTGGSEAAAANRQRLAAHLTKMAEVLTAMGEQAKIRDGIRRGGSKVPFEQRQTVFAQAGAQNERLLADFVRLAAALPKDSNPARP